MHHDGAPEALQEAEAEVEGFSSHAVVGTGCGQAFQAAQQQLYLSVRLVLLIISASSKAQQVGCEALWWSLINLCHVQCTLALGQTLASGHTL